MKDLDEAKDGKKTKIQDVSEPKEEPKTTKKVEETVKNVSPPKEEPKMNRNLKRTVRDEVKAEKKPKAGIPFDLSKMNTQAPVKKEEPPTDKTPKQ